MQDAQTLMGGILYCTEGVVGNDTARGGSGPGGNDTAATSWDAGGGSSNVKSWALGVVFWLGSPLVGWC